MKKNIYKIHILSMAPRAFHRVESNSYPKEIFLQPDFYIYKFFFYHSLLYEKNVLNLFPLNFVRFLSANQYSMKRFLNTNIVKHRCVVYNT